MLLNLEDEGLNYNANFEHLGKGTKIKFLKLFLKKNLIKLFKFFTVIGYEALYYSYLV
jgi:hypothetical protein